MIPKNEARQLAQTATPEQIKQMLETARVEIKDWTKPGSNPQFDLGATFNIFWRTEDWGKSYGHPLSRQNAIRNFGEFFPGRVKPEGKKKKVAANMRHEIPIGWEQDWPPI